MSHPDQSSPSSSVPEESSMEAFNPEMAQKDLLKLLDYRMPYGKHTGSRLIDLPEPYVVWLVNNGLPKGELGRMLGILYEIKANGLEPMLRPLIK